jgi:multidrug efflux pump subunit AcrA (membrane-fusion protein)
MDLKKWFFGIGLSAQTVIIVMMFFSLKELRQGTEAYDPYLETAQEFPLVEETYKPTHHKEVQIPFSYYVKGNGKVIPSSDYIKVRAPLQGIIENVYVTMGQKVSEGDLLFKIDDSLLRCRLSEKESEIHTTILNLEMMQKGGNSLEMTIKEKEVQEFKDAPQTHKKEEELLANLIEKNGISDIELNQQSSLANMATNQLERILVEYEKMKSGYYDQKLGRALINEKRANCKTIEKQIRDCCVRAPINGRVLSIGIHPGEYYDALKETAILMGIDDPLHLRVYIDQKEAWKVTPSPNIRAIAIHKSNPKMHFILEYISVSPCFNKEEGLELVFAFDRNKNPVYLDEILDVYIEVSAETDKALIDYQMSQTRY